VCDAAAVNVQKVAKLVIAVALVLAGARCAAQRIIYYPAGCADRLASAYKQQECVACVTRPAPHAYLPDQPDGTRCHPR
jgi:hypothetical protein